MGLFFDALTPFSSQFRTRNGGSEVPNAQAHFHRHDLDGDGVVSEAEVRCHVHTLCSTGLFLSFCLIGFAQRRLVEEEGTGRTLLRHFMDAPTKEEEV